MSDNVTHPNHYCKGGIECIEAIKAAVSGIADPFEAYCTGNIIKYAWRWSAKNGIEDLEKAKQYIKFIKEYRESKTKEPHTTYLEEMGEEDVGEVDEGRYANMSDEELQDKICMQNRDSITECEKCPLFKPSGRCDVENDCNAFPTFRKVAIAYLTEQDKAKESA